MADWEIGTARPGEVAALPAIERAAARLLRGRAPDAVLAEATPAADFESARRAGRLLVARAGDEPIGFALIEVLRPGELHLAEVDVHPDFGRRGIGAALVEAVCAGAAAGGAAAVTLTTFRDVPWNMPFYAKLGFHVLADAEIPSELAAVIADEARRGLDPARRVAMRRRCR